MTGRDVVDYQGNAALGYDAKTLASSGDTAAAYDKAQVRFNELANLNMQANQLKWQQKIKDRDQVMSAVAADQLQINNALPQDRPKLQAMIDDVKDFYFKNGADIKSDDKKWWDFNDKLSKFRDARVYAASRFDSYQKGMAEASQQLDPNKKQAQIDHYKSESETDINHAFTPYQQTLDWDESIIGKPIQQKEFDLGADPANPYNRVKQTKSQVKDSYIDYVNAYQYGGKQGIGINVDEWLKNWMGQTGLRSPQGVLDQASKVNNKLDQIAKEQGLNPDDQDSLPTYLKHLNVQNTDNGIQSAGTKWDDWFKIQLADQYKNESVSAYDKNLIDLQTKQSQIEANKARAGADYMNATSQRIKARAYSDYLNAKGQNANQKTVADISQVYDTLVNKTDKIILNGRGQKIADAINVGELPAGYKNINGIVIDKAGKPTAGKLEPFVTTTDKKPYWKVHYYDPQSGERRDVSNDATLKTLYQKNLQQLGLNSNQLSYLDYIRTLVKKQALGVEFEGKNGTANIYSLGQSIRAINDQIVGKGDESVFGTGSDDNNTQQTDNSDQNTNQETQNP
jgi:hypothetical protein